MPLNLTTTDDADLAFALADQLDANDETTLGPTDSALAALALRRYVAFLDASTPGASDRA